MAEVMIIWLIEGWDLRMCLSLKKRAIMDLDAFKGHFIQKVETQNF